MLFNVQNFIPLSTIANVYASNHPLCFEIHFIFNSLSHLKWYESSVNIRLLIVIVKVDWHAFRVVCFECWKLYISVNKVSVSVSRSVYSDPGSILDGANKINISSRLK